MRKTIEKLLSKTIIFKYKLPNGAIDKSIISSKEDECFSVSSNTDLANLIYNGIADYALGEKNVDINNLELCQRKALISRMRFDENAEKLTKIKYGFYGEVVLDLILKYSFKSSVLLAKGYFYSPLEKSETKGYDAYQFYYNNGQLVLLLGEAKFYSSFTKAIKNIIANLSKATSMQYFNDNCLALINEKDNFESIPPNVATIIEKWDKNPQINLYDEVIKHHIQLNYPMVVIYDERENDYDKEIEVAINEINTEAKKNPLLKEMDIELFFILIPVNSAKLIKEEVITWISQGKPLL